MLFFAGAPWFAFSICFLDGGSLGNPRIRRLNLVAYLSGKAFFISLFHFIKFEKFRANSLELYFMSRHPLYCFF